MMCGIQELPIELRLAILHLALDHLDGKTIPYYRALGVMQLVCQLWYDDIEDDPTFWRIITRAAPEDVIEDLLVLSGDAAITIKNAPCDAWSCPLPKLMELIEPHRSRWRHAELALNDTTLPLVEPWIKGSFPLLESLTLLWDDRHPFRVQPDISLGSECPPRLARLEFHGVFPKLNGWTNITSLVISGSYRTPPPSLRLDTMLAGLRGCPNLRELHLSLAGNDDEEEVEVENSPIDARQLRRLVLHWSGRSTRILPLLRLNASTLRHMNVSFSAGWYDPGPSRMAGTASDNFNGCLRALMSRLPVTYIDMWKCTWIVTAQQRDRSYKCSIACREQGEDLPWLIKFLDQASGKGKEFGIRERERSGGSNWMNRFSRLRLRLRSVEAWPGRSDVLDALAEGFWRLPIPHQLIVDLSLQGRIKEGTLSAELCRLGFLGLENTSEPPSPVISGADMLILRVTPADPHVVFDSEWDGVVERIKLRLGVKAVFVHDNSFDGTFDAAKYEL